METKSFNGNQVPDALFLAEKCPDFLPRKLMPIAKLKEPTTPQQNKTSMFIK